MRVSIGSKSGHEKREIRGAERQAVGSIRGCGLMACLRQDAAPPLRVRFDCGALSPVLAARAAARPPLAGFEIFAAPGNPVLPRLGFLGGLDPADPLVASQRRDVPPRRQRGFVLAQRVGQIGRQRVDGATLERLRWPGFDPGVADLGGGHGRHSNRAMAERRPEEGTAAMDADFGGGARG